MGIQVLSYVTFWVKEFESGFVAGEFVRNVDMLRRGNGALVGRRWKRDEGTERHEAVAATWVARDWMNALVALQGVVVFAGDEVQFEVAERTEMRITLHEIQTVKVGGKREMVVSTKDLRRVRFVFDKPASWVDSFREDLLKRKEKVAGGGEEAQKMQNLREDEFDSDFAFDPQEEFELLQKSYPERVAKRLRPKLVDQGERYVICASYPRRFALPVCVSVAQMQAVARYRSRGRIPVIRYIHPRSGAILARSSQPMTGILQLRSKVDEDVLEMIAQTSNSGKLAIVDARGRPAILGNTLMGKGVERPGRYQNAFLVLCQIGNIHTMRTSLFQLIEAIEHDNDEEFINHVEHSKWLRYISLLISSSVQIAKLLEVEETSVLVHCSDGFDRTPQLICLAKLMLSSRYRTIEGFCRLMSSEWCDFGHKFLDRSDDPESQEYSPIFLQFLDAVHNVLLQHSAMFEFGESLLLFLATAVYSGSFDTFLFNSHKERQSGTRSIWGYIMKNSDQFSQPSYTASEASFFPSGSRKVIQLWRAYFLRTQVSAAKLQQWRMQDLPNAG